MPCRINSKGKNLFSLIAELETQRVTRGNFCEVSLTKLQKWTKKDRLIESMIVFQSNQNYDFKNKNLQPQMKFEEAYELTFPIEIDAWPGEDFVYAEFGYLTQHISDALAESIFETFDMMLTQIVDYCLAKENYMLFDMISILENQRKRLLDAALTPSLEIDGKLFNNAIRYVLNEDLELLPLGVKGELVLGLDNLPSWLKKEDLIPDHFRNEGDVMYRTGYIAQWKDQGVLDVVGPKETQLVVNGYPIAIDLIRSEWQDKVQECEFLVLEKSLFAFVVPQNASTSALWSHLAETIPAHMVPKIIIPLESMPTNNGQVFDLT